MMLITDKIAKILINQLLDKYKTRNLSDIARILKTTRQKISMIIKGKNKLSNYLLFKIADELEIDIKQLIIMSEIENSKTEEEKQYWVLKQVNEKEE